MILLEVFNIIGTIVFAISGALVGMKKDLDLFGVITLSIVTASWGGMFRDIIIGNLPPTLLKEPKYIVICIVTSLVTFIVYPILLEKNIVKRNPKRLNLITFFDSIGLAAFTALGAKMAITHNMNTLFTVVCMGLLTGVGGGVIRDIFVRDIPVILKKDIYASASAIGALLMYFTYSHVSELVAIYLCFVTTFSIHILSVVLDIHLPKARLSLNSDRNNKVS